MAAGPIVADGTSPVRYSRAHPASFATYRLLCMADLATCRLCFARQGSKNLRMRGALGAVVM